MSTVRTTITIEREGPFGAMGSEAAIEIEVECRFEFYPARRGARDSLGGVPGAGPPLEPDEDAMLEFEGATAAGVEVDLTQKEQDKAEEQAWDQMRDAANDYDERD